MTTITTRTGSYYGDNTQNVIFEVHDEEGLVGELYVEAEHFYVANIEVRENRRGEGIARALYESAVAQLGTVYHMAPWGCTPEGAAFAEAVGGPVLDDETAAAITGTDLDFLS